MHNMVLYPDVVKRSGIPNRSSKISFSIQQSMVKINMDFVVRVSEHSCNIINASGRVWFFFVMFSHFTSSSSQISLRLMIILFPNVRKIVISPVEWVFIKLMFLWNVQASPGWNLVAFLFSPTLYITVCMMQNFSKFQTESEYAANCDKNQQHIFIKLCTLQFIILRQISLN